MLQSSSRGGCLPGPRGVCLVPGGSAWSGGILPAGGVSLPGGFSLPRGGGCLPCPRGGSPETPPVNRITDTCKNITLATTSLRPVMIIQLLKSEEFHLGGSLAE